MARAGLKGLCPRGSAGNLCHRELGEIAWNGQELVLPPFSSKGPSACHYEHSPDMQLGCCLIGLLRAPVLQNAWVPCPEMGSSSSWPHAYFTYAPQLSRIAVFTALRRLQSRDCDAAGAICLGPPGMYASLGRGVFTCTGPN